MRKYTSNRDEMRFERCRSFHWATVEIVLEYCPNKNSRLRSNEISSTVETNLEHDQKIASTAKKISSTVETNLGQVWKKSWLRSKQTSCTVEEILEHGQNKSREWSKQISRTAETNLANSRNKSRARLKQISCTFGRNFEEISITLEANLLCRRIISQAWSKKISSTIERNLEHDRNKSRARTKQTLSGIGTFIEQGKNIYSRWTLKQSILNALSMSEFWAFITQIFWLLLNFDAFRKLFLKRISDEKIYLE